MPETAKHVEELGLEQLAKALNLVYRLFHALVLFTLLLLCFSGVHRVEPGQEGHILRLGRWQGEAEAPGFHLAMPFFIDQVHLFDVGNVSSLDLDVFAPIPSQEASGLNQTALLSQEGSTVQCRWKLSYRLKNPREAWNIAVPGSEGETVFLKKLLRSACVEAATSTPIDTILYRPAAFRALVQDLFSTALNRFAGWECLRLDLTEPSLPQQTADAFQEVQRARLRLDTQVNGARAFAQSLAQRTESETGALLSEAKAVHADIVNSLRAEAMIISELLDRGGEGERDAYLKLRLQEVLRKSAASSKGQVFVLKSGNELRLRLNQDPVLEMARQKKEKKKQQETAN